MEATHHAPGPIGWDSRSGFQVFRETRVKGCCEGPVVAPAKAPHGPTKWSLCRDMNNFRPKFRDKTRQFALGCDGKSDFRIAWRGHAAEAVGTYHFDRIAHGSQPVRHNR